MERLLDKAGQRAQEVERGAEAAAEEGEVAVAAKGVGGAFGYLGGRRSSSPGATRARLLERWLARRELAGGNGGAGCGRTAYGLARGTG